jgi:predicted transcriptional regulator
MLTFNIKLYGPSIQNRNSIKPRNGKRKIEIMDTTPVMVNKPQECLLFQKANHCALLLEELNVDRIEIASARVRRRISRSKRDNGL